MYLECEIIDLEMNLNHVCDDFKYSHYPLNDYHRLNSFQSGDSKEIISDVHLFLMCDVTMQFPIS